MDLRKDRFCNSKKNCPFLVLRFGPGTRGKGSTKTGKTEAFSFARGVSVCVASCPMPLLLNVDVSFFMSLVLVGFVSIIGLLPMTSSLIQ